MEFKRGIQVCPFRCTLLRSDHFSRDNSLVSVLSFLILKLDSRFYWEFYCDTELAVVCCSSMMGTLMKFELKIEEYLNREYLHFERPELHV